MDDTRSVPRSTIPISSLVLSIFGLEDDECKITIFVCYLFINSSYIVQGPLLPTIPPFSSSFPLAQPCTNSHPHKIYFVSSFSNSIVLRSDMRSLSKDILGPFHSVTRRQSQGILFVTLLIYHILPTLGFHGKQNGGKGHLSTLHTYLSLQKLFSYVNTQYTENPLET